MMDNDLGGQITHDALTLTYFCYTCSIDGFLVMEYGQDGKTWWLGQYTKYHMSLSEYCNAMING